MKREDRLRDALVPLAEHGVTPEQAMELMLAASAAVRDGLGIGWYHVEQIRDAVYGVKTPSIVQKSRHNH